MLGIFLARGMTFGIRGLKIGVDESGGMSVNATCHVHFDVCPTWLGIALHHLKDARIRYDERVAAWANDDEQAKADTLERELESSMQAIVAAAVAVDAFYEVLCKKAEIPESLVKTWRKNRTARYKQAAEVFRIAFRLRDARVAVLRKSLGEIQKVRDLAIHPSGETHPPMKHPELPAQVERQFAIFRFDVAEMIVQTVGQMLLILTHIGRPKNDNVQKYAEVLQKRLNELGVVLTPSNAEALAARSDPREP